MALSGETKECRGRVLAGLRSKGIADEEGDVYSDGDRTRPMVGG